MQSKHPPSAYCCICEQLFFCTVSHHACSLGWFPLGIVFLLHACRPPTQETRYLKARPQNSSLNLPSLCRLFVWWPRSGFLVRVNACLMMTAARNHVATLSQARPAPIALPQSLSLALMPRFSGPHPLPPACTPAAQHSAAAEVTKTHTLQPLQGATPCPRALKTLVVLGRA